jgi:uncharacterized protein YqeY
VAFINCPLKMRSEALSSFTLSPDIRAAVAMCKQITGYGWHPDEEPITYSLCHRSAKMDILSRLQGDMVTALKAGQKERLTVIRMLLSDVKNIDLAPKPITALQAVESYAKKLRKSMEEYEKLGKPTEVEKFRAELAIVEEYLPKKASTEDTAELVDEFLAKNSFTEKQMGQAMGMFMKAHGGQVDAGQANTLIKQKLAGK